MSKSFFDTFCVSCAVALLFDIIDKNDAALIQLRKASTVDWEKDALTNRLLSKLVDDFTSAKLRTEANERKSKCENKMEKSCEKSSRTKVAASVESSVDVNSATVSVQFTGEDMEEVMKQIEQHIQVDIPYHLASMDDPTLRKQKESLIAAIRGGPN